MLTVTFICPKRPFPLASNPPKHPKIQHTAGGRYIYPASETLMYRDFGKMGNK